MRSGSVLALVVPLCTLLFVHRTNGDDTVYLVDFLGNSRPKYTDEINSENEKQGRSSSVGTILINNPLKNSEARADGIYFRPENGQPLDRKQVKVRLFFIYINLYLYVKVKVIFLIALTFFNIFLRINLNENFIFSMRRYIFLKLVFQFSVSQIVVRGPSVVHNIIRGPRY